jgi:hypothetical protein
MVAVSVRATVTFGVTSVVAGELLVHPVMKINIAVKIPMFNLLA